MWRFLLTGFAERPDVAPDLGIWSAATAHMAGQIITVVTAQTAIQPAAVAVALAFVSETLRRPVTSPPADGMADSRQPDYGCRCGRGSLLGLAAPPLSVGCSWPLTSVLPIAANSRTGQVPSRPSSRVRSPGSSPGAVALRSQTALTGSARPRTIPAAGAGTIRVHG
jgi:hypothetical protein